MAAAVVEVAVEQSKAELLQAHLAAAAAAAVLVQVAEAQAAQAEVKAEIVLVRSVVEAVEAVAHTTVEKQMELVSQTGLALQVVKVLLEELLFTKHNLWII